MDKEHFFQLNKKIILLGPKFIKNVSLAINNKIGAREIGLIFRWF
jgi:hypothetical protein